MRRVLEPFKDAIEALEGDYIALPLVTRIMSMLDSHIEAEIAASVPGSSSANATEVMLLDHTNRWSKLPNVVNIAAALQWRDTTEMTLWRRIVLVEYKKLFQADIAEEVWARSASNGMGRLEKRDVDGERHPGRSTRRDNF